MVKRVNLFLVLLLAGIALSGVTVTLAQSDDDERYRQ